MKKTDMELQAIRDKLRLLESEPPAGEVLPMPWSSPQRSSFGRSPFNPQSFSSAAAQPIRQSSSQQTSQKASQRTDQQPSGASAQAVAIEALKQRSGGQSTKQNTPTNVQGSRADDLISQEIYRLEVHAHNINERSQQQANEILALKRSAQQAALALRRQGIHSHAQLDIIAQFLAPYPSAAVPHLERDSQGHFALSHTTINLHHAEQEAQSTAETLRNRKSASPSTYQRPYADHASKGSDVHTELSGPIQPVATVPFAQPVSTGPSIDDYLEGDVTASPSHSRPGRKRPRWTLNLGKLFHRIKREPPAYSTPKNNRFSWMDGAIWFSGAAIARIMLEAIVLSYPILRMPLLLILFSVISFAIYRVVVSNTSNLTAAYRLGVTLLGLFLGSSF